MADRDATGDRGTVPGWPVLAALALPLAGLALLLARPELDVRWEHQPSHFWLVLLAAALSIALALLTNEAASRHADARVVLVSLAFLLSAGFLGLHALATPGVLLPEPNTGFFVATPVGLVLASVAAAASTGPLAGPRAGWILRHRGWLRGGVIALLLGWAVVSLLRLPPLDGPPTEEAGTVVAIAAVGTVGLYGFAAWRYAQIARRRASRFALVIAAALVLLAEAMVAVAFSRSWHLSWWEWHVLMTAAFGLIAIGARHEYRRTGSLVATFEPIYQRATLDQIDRWHGRAIADLAEAEARGESPDRLVAELRREGASSDQLALMLQAAREIRRVDELFRPYLPRAYADQLRSGSVASDPPQEREVSVVFADLAGFTSFSEEHDPTEVITMLNEQWEAAVPVIEAADGAIEHFAGDGILVLFNAVGDQPDHGARAVRCALDLVHAADRMSESRARWPRFRVGVNTGPAAVGTVGAGGRRSFATIGDTTNLGSRLMGAGSPGQVVISSSTRRAIEPLLETHELEAVALGPLTLKGKREPVPAWVVRYSVSAR
ncbi:MAG TPA: adenylate/guanylate cyclase domain-containing protein [Candidatus Angelobacter sp.]|nr:adenylate/guanylate cyclase domain-containing protein [Candidatus Angelobacter sp.]